MQLYSTYPNMAMVLGLEGTKPPVLQVVPNSANFTVPGNVNVYVRDTTKNATVLAFILGVVSIRSLRYAIVSSLILT